MKKLKYIRTAIGLLLILVATAYVLKGQQPSSYIGWIEQMQILPHQKILLPSVAILMVWLMMTLAFGRIYCACVCPVGVLQDLIRSIVKHLPRKWNLSKPGRYAVPRRTRYIMAVIYAVALCLGTVAAIVPFALNPWSEYANMVQTVSNHPVAESATWVVISAVVGVICGLLALLVVAAMSVLCGRDYCNTVCPVGIALGASLKPFGGRAVVNVDIDPDRCIHCMKCEETCPAHCIDVKNNLVDNERCIRCMDCLPVCPEDAINYTMKRPKLTNTQTI